MTIHERMMVIERLCALLAKVAPGPVHQTIEETILKLLQTCPAP